MFCNQCEQTQGGRGCTEVGVCGKDPDMQSLQEILLYGVKGMAAYANHARRLGKSDDDLADRIADAFTAAHPDFVPLNAAEALEAAGVENAAALVTPAGHLRLWPHKHATDGFYAAVWQKKD